MYHRTKGSNKISNVRNKSIIFCDFYLSLIVIIGYLDNFHNNSGEFVRGFNNTKRHDNTMYGWALYSWFPLCVCTCFFTLIQDYYRIQSHFSNDLTNYSNFKP